MRIRIVAFASASEALGASEVELTLDEEATVGSLRDALTSRRPALAEVWPRLAIAVDGELAAGDSPLADGVEVALLPPVSGGSPANDDGDRDGSVAGGDIDSRAPAAPGAAGLVDGPIDVDQLVREVSGPASGAVLLFLGTVRNDHQGRAVERLTYHAYRSMAENTLKRLIRELEAEADGTRVGIVHRLGEVPIGEASVAIVVASPHRELAYETSRQALERLKREVPIWKRELYGDGKLAWREEESLARVGE